MFTPARLIATTLGLALATPAVAAPTTERPPSSMTSCATTDWSCLGPYRAAPLPYGVPSSTTYRPYRIKLPSSTFHPDKGWTWPTGDTAVYANMTEGLVGEDVNDTRNLNLKGPFDLLHV